MESKPPGPKSTKEKPRSKTEKSSRSKVEKPKTPRDPPKKTHKIVIRKLPIRDFTQENFAECVAKFCLKLGLDQESMQVEHFMQGKLRYKIGSVKPPLDCLILPFFAVFVFKSRKHGPVPSAGFVCVKDEETLKAVVTISLDVVPFLDGDTILYFMLYALHN